MVVAKKQFTSSIFGSVNPGDKLDEEKLTNDDRRHYLEYGMIEDSESSPPAAKKKAAPRVKKPAAPAETK